MRACILLLVFSVAAASAKADDVSPVRVISLTKESADASAAAIAAAKSPLIGAPPPARRVAAAATQAAVSNEKRQPGSRGRLENARAELVAADMLRETRRPRKRVVILTPGAEGGFSAQAYEVPLGH